MKNSKHAGEERVPTICESEAWEIAEGVVNDYDVLRALAEHAHGKRSIESVNAEISASLDCEYDKAIDRRSRIYGGRDCHEMEVA